MICLDLSVIKSHIFLKLTNYLYMKKIFLFSIAFFLFSGCSLQKMAVRSSTGLLYHGLDAIYQEPDLKIAEQAIASDLKLVEGFLRADPGNKKLLLLLTQGYASYSLGFVEDEEPARAKLFYLRARDYGLRLLQKTSAFKKGIPEQEKPFISALHNLRREDVPALFWCAFAWAGWINLSKDDPQAVFDLGKVKAMMRRVLELDEGYFFGAAHLFFGSVYGSLPKMLGGNPQKAYRHFQQCETLSGGKFLLVYVYLARYYAQPKLDEALFDSYLKKVLQAPANVLPGYQLITAIAKNKAQTLMTKKEDLF